MCGRSEDGGFGGIAWAVCKKIELQIGQGKIGHNNETTGPPTKTMGGELDIRIAAKAISCNYRT